jgi:RNA polymerase sigma factor CnrH
MRALAITEQYEDARLITRARAGDQGAFAVFVERYQQPIGAYLGRLLRDPEAALDLTQETFVRAYYAIGQTKSDLLIRPWLYRIATNLARDHARHQRRFAWLPLRLIDHWPAPSALSAIEDEDLVRQALAGLASNDRTVLLLCGLEDFSYAEAAAVFGASAEAVRKRFGRAKERFRAAYGQIRRDTP